MRGLEIVQSEKPTLTSENTAEQAFGLVLWVLKNCQEKKKKKTTGSWSVDCKLRGRWTHYEVEQNVSWSFNHSTKTAQPSQRRTAGTACSGSLWPPGGSTSAATSTLRQVAKHVKWLETMTTIRCFYTVSAFFLLSGQCFNSPLDKF